MYLACPTNSLKGPELSTLVFGVSRPGMAHFNLNILNCCMYRINGVHRMRRLMCIFVISMLKAIANRSPYISTLVQKVKRKVYKIHVFLREAKLCRESARMTCTCCTDEVREKVPSFKKVTLFLRYKP